MKNNHDNEKYLREMLLDDSPLKADLNNEIASAKKPIPSMHEYLKNSKSLKKDNPIKGNFKRK